MSDDEFDLVPLAGGVYSLRARANGQTFHPVVGPAAEARAVHIGGTRLIERANTWKGSAQFVIWDVGLGAAANAIAALDTLAAGYRGTADITMVSFDRSTTALDFALKHARKLRYPLSHLDALHRLRNAASVKVSLPSGACVHWSFVTGEFPSWLDRADAEASAPNAIFFDPYSPAVNRDMWTLEVFTKLRARLSEGAPCLLTNYTRSTAVRVTLLLAGFCVGLGPATGEKEETTVATNAMDLLERPLPRAWLDKVRASTNAAPLRASSQDSRGPIDEADFARLRQHRQFAE